MRVYFLFTCLPTTQSRADDATGSVAAAGETRVKLHFTKGYICIYATCFVCVRRLVFNTLYSSCILYNVINFLSSNNELLSIVTLNISGDRGKKSPCAYVFV